MTYIIKRVAGGDLKSGQIVTEGQDGQVYPSTVVDTAMGMVIKDAVKGQEIRVFISSEEISAREIPVYGIFTGARPPKLRDLLRR